MISKILGLDKGTRERAVVTIVTAVINVLVHFNIVSFSDDQIDSIVKLAVTVVAGIVWAIGFYYNENYSPEMCEATGEARLRKKTIDLEENEGIGGDTNGQNKVDEEL